MGYSRDYGRDKEGFWPKGRAGNPQEARQKTVGRLGQARRQTKKRGEEMKLIYGISRWTNANSNKRTHIPDEHGLPICMKSNSPYQQHTYETTDGDCPTCMRCLKLMEAQRESANACCPHLQIKQCADSNKHCHLYCEHWHKAHGELVPNYRVAEVCVGVFEDCNYYHNSISTVAPTLMNLPALVLEGATAYDN